IGLGVIIVGTLVASIATAVASWLAFLAVVGAVTTIVLNLVEPFSNLISTLPTLGDILDGAQKKLEEMGAAWAPWAAQAGVAGQIVTAVLVGLSGVIQSLQFILQGNFPAAAESARAALGSFGDAAVLVAQVITTTVAAAFDWLTNTAIPTVVTVVTTVITRLQDAWKNFTDGFTQGMSADTLQQFGDAFHNLGVAVDQFGQALGQILQIIGAVFAAQQAASEGTNVWAQAGQFAGRLFAGLALIVNGLSFAIAATAIALNNSLTAFRKWVDDVKSAVDKIPGIVKAIGDAFSNLGTSIQNSIQSVLQALQDGLLGGLKAVIGPWRAIWQSIPQDIQADLGIVAGLLGQRIAQWASTIMQGMANIVSAFREAWSNIVQS